MECGGLLKGFPPCFLELHPDAWRVRLRSEWKASKGLLSSGLPCVLSGSQDVLDLEVSHLPLVMTAKLCINNTLRVVPEAPAVRDIAPRYSGSS